ncbi:MAG: hypothetical protein OES09_16840, partial [Gammaproteobacteria bacterium]|nr:hypothetical protein [Gammaproteobacteria bacterium]
SSPPQTVSRDVRVDHGVRVRPRQRTSLQSARAGATQAYCGGAAASGRPEEPLTDVVKSLENAITWEI